MTTLADLLAQRAALDNQIATARTEGTAKAYADIAQILEENGLTVAELVAHFSKSKGKGKQATAGSTVAPKYRNAMTGETWSGRGLQPRWLKAAVEAGRRVEEFAI